MHRLRVYPRPLARAALAQPVEQRIRNAWVGCSSHPGGTILLLASSLEKREAWIFVDCCADAQRNSRLNRADPSGSDLVQRLLESLDPAGPFGLACIGI